MREQDEIQSKFESLPLEEKLSNLFKMEVVTITEAINYVAKDPMIVINKIGEVVKEFGSRIESEVRKAASSSKADDDASPPPSTSAGTGRRRSSQKPPSPPV